MAYCAWCRSWGRGPVVKLSEPRHVVLGDGVKIIGSIAVVPVAAGKTICRAHQTIGEDECRQRMRGTWKEPDTRDVAPHILLQTEVTRG